MQLKQKEFHIKSINPVTRSIDAVFSTDTIDSYGEVVDQQTWQLQRYMKNPVVLLSHKSSSFFGSPVEALPIGRVEGIAVRDGKLQGTVVFASAEANPIAEQVFKLYAEGTMKAFSVGMKPHTIKVEKRNGTDITVLSNCELFEISAVALPANPDAVMKSADVLSDTEKFIIRCQAKGQELLASRPRHKALGKPARDAEGKPARDAEDDHVPPAPTNIAPKKKSAVMARANDAAELASRKFTGITPTPFIMRLRKNPRSAA